MHHWVFFVLILNFGKVFNHVFKIKYCSVWPNWISHKMAASINISDPNPGPTNFETILNTILNKLKIDLSNIVILPQTRK